ncbi:MAG: hypothetical protein WD066_00005 [Planctomycetaceae bacterium]
MLRIAFLCCACSAVLAPCVSARADDAATRSAEVEAEFRLPVPLDVVEKDAQAEGWLKVPEYLRGAMIHWKPSRPLGTVGGRRLKCSVNQPGVLLVAATWDEPPDANGSWRNTHWKPAKLLEEGWTPIGMMQQRTAEMTLGYTIFRRVAAAGDEYEFHTNPDHAPLAIIPAADHVEAIVALPAIVAASNPVVALDPPDAPAPRAGAETLMLDAHEHRGFAETFNWTDMFSREIARQAILVAAREELGLSTRDGMLREEFPADGDDGPVARSVMVIKRHLGSKCEMTVTIFHQEGDRYVADWEGELANPSYRVAHLLATDLEKLSRTEYPALLRSLGFQGEAVAFREQAPVPAEIERKLAHFAMLSQFAAVRDLHALAKNEGSSPEILAGLTRGYANLSVLTDHLWAPAHNVFKARAMIYAERCIALGGDAPSPESLLVRGYARALAGMHVRSDDDFKAAGAKLAAIDKSQELPEWAALVWAFVKYDNEKLLAAEDAGGQQSLARMLRLLSLKGTEKVQPVAVVKAAGRMIELVPDCDRASAMLQEINKWEVQRPLVAERSRYYAKRLYPSLEDLANAPSNVARFASLPEEEDIAKESLRRRELIDALKKSGRPAGDRGEPSLDALGQLIVEAGFVHAVDQFWYRVRWQGADIGEELEALRPAIEQHPYFPFARFLSVDVDQQREIAAEFVPSLEGPVEVAQLQENERTMLSTLNRIDPSKNYWNRLGHPASRHEGRDVFRELVNAYEKNAGWRQSAMRNEMPHVDRHLPFTVAYMVAHDWRTAQNRLAGIESKYWHDGVVLLRLGEQYLARDQLDDAQRVLERCVGLGTTYDGYLPLASIHWKRKDYDRWQKTLEGYLTFPFVGMEWPMTRIRIAKYLLIQGKREEALPHAEYAATTRANWALVFAAQCHEEVGNRERTEQYLMLAANRYANYGSALHWLAFCRRTGRGDENAARDFARRHLESLGELPPEKLGPTVEYYLYIDEPENALEMLRHVFDNTKNPRDGMLLAVIADDLDEAEVRDAALRQVAETKDAADDVRFHVDLAALLRKSFAAGAKPRLESAALEALVKNGKTGQPTFAWYAVGRFLANRDLREESDRYLRLAAGSPRWLEVAATLAWADLREREVEIERRRPVEVPGQDPPEPQARYSEE